MNDARLRIPLYHGTSSIFLEDILRLGLGGKNPFEKLGLFEFVREIAPLIGANLSDTDTYRARSTSFALMAEQFSGGQNYQHGQTYLSPSKDTAIRYASSNRYGSEILTYTLDFLQLLVDRDVPTVRDRLYQKYRSIFWLLDVSAAPVLVTAANVSMADLLSERGADPTQALERVDRMIAEFPDRWEMMLQQTNFRLTAAVPSADLTVSFINVTRFQPLKREYVLYELNRESREQGHT